MPEPDIPVSVSMADMGNAPVVAPVSFKYIQKECQILVFCSYRNNLVY